MGTYHLTAACLDHAAHIGYSPERMEEFCVALLMAMTFGDDRSSRLVRTA